jgi:hypothetical protein
MIDECQGFYVQIIKGSELHESSRRKTILYNYDIFKNRNKY